MEVTCIGTYGGSCIRMIATAKMANSSTGGEIILVVTYGLKAKGRLFGISIDELLC